MSGEKAENEQRQSALKEVRSPGRTKEKKYWGRRRLACGQFGTNCLYKQCPVRCAQASPPAKKNVWSEVLSRLSEPHQIAEKEQCLSDVRRCLHPDVSVIIGASPPAKINNTTIPTVASMVIILISKQYIT